MFGRFYCKRMEIKVIQAKQVTCLHKERYVTSKEQPKKATECQAVSSWDEGYLRQTTMQLP